MRTMLVVWSVSMLLAPAALGVDGVREINQACAENTGCFAGDPLGFPVTIASPGSYVLTGNLSVSSSADAIEITADGVSIDLNGLEIAGPVTCENEGSGVICDGSGGVGIDAFSQSRVTIRGGTVRGFGFGIEAGHRALVRDVIVASNGFTGLAADPGSIISSVTAYRNGSFGMFVLWGAVVRASSASGNGFTGILVGDGSTVVDSAVHDNGGNGIDVRNSVVRNSSAYLNAGNGIECGKGCALSDNSAFDNKFSGIQVGDGSMVQRSVMRDNGWYGLRFYQASQATYRENTITGNGLGTVDGAGVNMFSNSCDGGVTCP